VVLLEFMPSPREPMLKGGGTYVPEEKRITRNLWKNKTLEGPRGTKEKKSMWNGGRGPKEISRGR